MNKTDEAFEAIKRRIVFCCRFVKRVIFSKFAILLYSFTVFSLIIAFIWAEKANFSKSFPNIYDSFMASAFEDILFFALVGLAAAVISIQDHTKDKIRARIENLFTFDYGLGKEAEHDIINRIKKLAVYSNKNEMTIYIEEYNKNFDSFKLAVHQKIDLKNMLHDIAYDYERDINMEVDEIENFDQKLYGQIIHLEFNNNEGYSNTILNYRDLKDRKASYKIEEIIPPKGRASTTMNFWFWNSLSKDFFYSSHHTSPNTSIKIVNKLDDMIPKIIYKENELEWNGDKEIDLLCGDDRFLTQGGKTSFKFSL